MTTPSPGRPRPARRQEPLRWRARVAHARRLAHRQVGAAGAGWRTFVAWFNALELSENAILLTFAVVIGVVGALGVIAFYSLIDLAYTLFFRWPLSLVPAMGVPLYRPLFTAAGLALAWWIVRAFCQGEEGQNVPAVQLAVARGRSLPVQPVLGRTAASAVTLGSGGSAGSEGPVAVLGATVGSVLGRIFQFDASRVGVLVAAGAAAGISAAFNAPLAGAFFALEEVLGSLAVGAFPPVVVASVVAAVVSRAVLGDHPAFPIPMEYGYELGREIFLFFPLLGALAGLVAVLYVRTYFGSEALVRRSGIPPALRPWIGGLLVGALVLASGGVLVGYGHLAIRLEMFGRMAWSTLALLALGKIVATSLTLAMGGSGGVFTPSLYIGAASGGAFGVALSQLFPSLGIHPEAYALVGMGAVVAVATGAPITAILIVFEMTNDYAIMLPLMLTTVVSLLVARHFERDSLYSGWLRRRGENLEHGADRDVLAGIHVRDAYERNPQVVGEEATVAQMLEHLDRSEQSEILVVDRELRLVGVITLGDLARVAVEQTALAPVLLAVDLARPPETVTPNDSLLEAVRRLGVRGAGALPVVRPGTETLAGMLTRAHILTAYQRAIAREEPPSGEAP